MFLEDELMVDQVAMVLALMDKALSRSWTYWFCCFFPAWVSLFTSLTLNVLAGIFPQDDL